MSRTKRAALSLFIVLNLSTVLYSNRPPASVSAVEAVVRGWDSPELTYRSSLYAWYLRSYAHIVGLDNRWVMFGRQSRFNWWYRITAQYADAETVLLPLPRQSDRNFFEAFFVDFKEGKFDLNLYSKPVDRHIYSRYLCRQHLMHDGARIERIVWELHYQNILPPEQAVVEDRHLETAIHSRMLNDFPCRVAGP